MSKLEQVYPAAIEQTKQKLFEDIDAFMERQDAVPSFHDYMEVRKAFIDQIWINIWLNKASNDVPKKEKKQLLNEKGFVTDGVDKKIINKLFREEIRSIMVFNAASWLEQRFTGKEEEWEQRYGAARQKFFMRQEKAKVDKERSEFTGRLADWMRRHAEANFDLFYLHARHFAAREIQHDLIHNQRYAYVEAYRLEEALVEDGNFDADDYVTAGDFFEELTGGISSDWSSRSFGYETYYEHYENAVLEFVSVMVPEKLAGDMPPGLREEYKKLFNQDLNPKNLFRLIDSDCFELAEDMTLELAREYLEDLLELTELPFEEKLHQQIFERNKAERARRKAEEEAEAERKRAEEARVLEDIFGTAYIPSVGSRVRYVLHIGETNTGKTHRALESMKRAESGLYLAPLRLLALEVYDKLNEEGVPCSLKTGEEEKPVEGAKHVSSTVEMFHEKDFHDVIVIDEAQMIADKDRGFSWYRAITKANAREVHIIGSYNIKQMLFNLLEGTEIELHEYSRDVPLEVEQKEFELKHTKKGDALICFSRKRVLETAAKLQRSGHSVSMIYGSMPPETRKKQIEMFNSGKTSVVVATDAIGMGLNLPIRRIVFLETEKFDGTRRRTLTSQEVKQIAGRAGRKGIYDIGKVAFSADIKVMSRLLEKVDEPVQTFAIAPTAAVFERFGHHYRDLGVFFELWEKFEPPKGTKKASLSEERELYELIKGTPIEARFSMMDLYGFLHLPFSAKEHLLVRQWLETMMAIADGRELPDPVIKKKGLEDSELSYKAIGLHLLFLYRLDKRTEAVYWERLRDEISDEVHDHLKDEVENYRNKCKKCGKKLPENARFPICDACYHGKGRGRSQERGTGRRRR
ncbi:DEAD/DEAH box helicase [Bacillus sp. FJAT-27251]|uniref:DEAD/DEAH box helicase n=1 Tax=Bacillus sp. FJAT-27251 TaxID=1684142 RepID=UPI0006A78CE9|nr:DEAD/DEAH box helicase [Bacillus sp. FJAT-27251]